MAQKKSLITLMQPIVLELGHYGFAGHTSNRITIEVDGSWKVSGLLNGKEFCVHETGTLTQDELQSVVDALAALDHTSLPETLGQPVVNGGTLAIAFGEHRSTMNLDHSGNCTQLSGASGTRMLDFSKSITTIISPGKQTP